MSKTMNSNIGKSAKFVAIAICFLISVIDGFDLQAIGVAVPKLAPDLGLQKDQIGIALSATMFGLMGGAMSGGWFADKVGRRKTLSVGVFIFGLATLSTIFVVDTITLSSARLITGFGIGMAMPNIMAIATDISVPEKRASTAMIMFCGMPVGAGIVAALARALPDIPWELLFVVGGIPAVIAAPLIYILLPETAPKKSIESKQGLGIKKALFGDGRMWVTVNLWIAFALTLVVLYLLLNWLPSLIVDKGFKASDGATAALGFSTGSVIGALLLGVAVDKFGLRWPMAFVYACLICAFIGLSRATGLFEITLFSGICGACVVGSQFILYAIAPSYYPSSARGIGGGAAVAVGRLGAIAGPLAAGLLMQGGMSGDQVVMSLAPVVIAAGVSVFVLSYSTMKYNEE